MSDEHDNAAIERDLRRLEPRVDMVASRDLFERERRRPHRSSRRLLLSAAAAVLVVGGVFGLWALSVREEPAAPMSTVGGVPETTAAPTTTTMSSLLPRDELTLALMRSGVDVEAAPASVIELAGAVLCGMEQRGGQELTAEGSLDEEARRCFLDRHLSAQPAVFVEESPTTEGDPIVTVWRTSDDGTMEVYVDSTRDAYGSGQWSRQPCRQLTTSFPQSSEPFPASYFTCSSSSATTGESVSGSMPTPDWFELRSPLPLCGYVIDLDEPIPDQRECFADAVATGAPAELVVATTQDNGARVARWFRSRDDGPPEVFEWRSRSGSSANVPSSWLRYECTTGGLRFSDDPSSGADGALPLLEGSECSTDDAGPSADGGLDGPVVYAAPSGTDSETALGIGVVDLVDGCLLLVDDSDSSFQSTLLWAAETRWDAVANEVVLPDGNRVPIGTTISAGGGYHPAGGVSRFVADQEAVAEVVRCAVAGDPDGVFVIQAPVDVEP